jgi:valyl-tRNA synthetase
LGKNLTIATTRPETIFDTAICINPNDERFAHLKGKKRLFLFAEELFHY